MAGIKDYSPVPASNTALFPEGMAPSAVNDGMRQVQADIRAEVATKGTDIASAATVDLDDADGDFVDITGTTTITSLGTVSEGIRRTLRFKGALTLTHNATSLILPGGANITAADGDIARFRSLGEGNWQCEFYQKADGTAVVVDDSNYAKLDEANTFTANPKIEGGSATARLTLYRKAATTTDALAELLFDAQNADGDEITGALLRMLLIDATAGSEDGQLVVRLPIGGNDTDVATFGAGLQVGAPTGGDPGFGGLNLEKLQIDGQTANPVIAYSIGTTVNAPGYIEFANHLIFQWGAETIDINGSEMVTLPTAFSTALFAVMATGTAQVDNGEAVQAAPNGLSSVSITNGNISQRVYFFAIGV